MLMALKTKYLCETNTKVKLQKLFITPPVNTVDVQK